MSTSPASALFAMFQRGGYIRTPSEERQESPGPSGYKKGYEVRLVFASMAELKRARALIKKVGLNAGKAFPKHSRFVQPLYGIEAVEWFTERLRPRKARQGFAVDGRRLVRRAPDHIES